MMFNRKRFAAIDQRLNDLEAAHGCVCSAGFYKKHPDFTLHSEVQQQSSLFFKLLTFLKLEITPDIPGGEIRKKED